MEIYYFSGTGNSLHIAKELQRRIPGTKLIPIVSLLNKDVVLTNAETVGFVFPIYLTTIPAPVKNFLRKFGLSSAKYIFAVATREGSLCLADVTINKILKEKGHKMDSYFTINMADNSPTGLKPMQGDKGWADKITKEKVAALEIKVKRRLNNIQKIITSKEYYADEESGNPFYYLLEQLISFAVERSRREIAFYADSTCDGCGICEKVCLSEKIKITGGKPVWQESIKCFNCYACFNFCPNQSILNNNYSDKTGRYFHPDVTADEIAAQKEEVL